MSKRPTPPANIPASPPATAVASQTVNGPTTAAFPWRRLAICIVGIFILLFVWRWSTWYLYSLPKESIAVFGSITNSTNYAITFIVAYFITGQVYFTNWSMSSASNIVSEVKSYVESKTEKKVESTPKK